MSLREDMTNSSLSVLVYEEKDDFSSKMLSVNQARLSDLVSVMAQCVEALEEIVKMAASVKFSLISNLHTEGSQLTHHSPGKVTGSYQTG